MEPGVVLPDDGANVIGGPAGGQAAQPDGPDDEAMDDDDGGDVSDPEE